jgi:hypothetical protein
VFLLHGQPLALDTAFTDPETGIQYPANFLRLSTPEERAAIGITEVPDPPAWDQRFYWGYDAEGQLIPKDHAQLVEQWVQQTRTTANTLLQPTDWVIIREADNGKAADPVLKTWREEIRLAAGSKKYEIERTADTGALAAYITGADYSAWPVDPYTPQPVDSVQRARDEEGRFVADDPATPELNEAWVTASTGDTLLGQESLSFATGSTGAQVSL